MAVEEPTSVTSEKSSPNSAEMLQLHEQQSSATVNVSLERGHAGTGKSYQVRALVYKTLSYERRTICTTCCCVFMCPFVMVLICGILGSVVTALLSHVVTAENVQYCSNATALNYNTSIPVMNAPTDQTGRILYNFGQYTPCVSWFSHDYPFSEPYSPVIVNNGSCSSSVYNPEVCPLHDTTLLPAPRLGWLPDPFTTIPAQFGEILGYEFAKQNNFWGWYQEVNGLSIGTLPKRAPVDLFLSGPYVPTNYNDSFGFLGSFNTDYYFEPIQNVSALESVSGLASLKLERRPYFEKINGDTKAMDDQWSSTINSLLQQLDALTKPSKNTPTNSSEYQNYTYTVGQILAKIPYGALTMSQMSSNYYQYTMQVGTNFRLAYTSISNSKPTGGASAVPSNAFPTEGLRRILFQTRISQAIMNLVSALPSASISQGLRVFPENLNTGINFPIGSFIGQILYPFGISFLFPIFLLNLVKDKEERILVMMKMNGLKLWVYWLAEYIHFYVLHIISTIVFIVMGHILKLQFFTLTAPGVYILLFFLWGHVQILLAFTLSSFFQRSRYALLVAFILVVISVIINIATAGLYGSNPAPVAYFIWPPFAFYRAIAIVNQAAFTLGVPSYTVAMIVPGNELYSTIIAMVIAIIVLFFAAIYLYEVLPSEYGVRKPWHYPISTPWAWLMSKIYGNNKQIHMVEMESIAEQNKKEEDEDVIEERQRVEAGNYSSKSPLVFKNMKKYYGSKFAVKGITLAIEPGIVFGLLGPNGAGKTTLISILTGLYEASSGEAYLAGYKVGEEMDQVYRNMGVCPQHDILWPELTVEEHLYFYARLKGISPQEEDAAVTDALARVSLTKFRTRPSRGLSGGEKRRLSIAIALIGNGQVIFLDEPTTGLDPEVRRLIWNIITEQRQGKTIILTTHSMEEAEVLCQKIGIMAKGTLRCLGPQLHLKNKYGSGFKLVIAVNAEDSGRACSYVETLLPSGYKKLDSFKTLISYEFPFKENAVSTIFEQLSQHALEHGIQDWGLSQTSLEEVFLRIIDEADAMADS